MKYKVVSLLGIVSDKAEVLSTIDAQLIEASLKSEYDIIKEAGDADAVVVGSIEPYTKKAIEALKKCKIISRQGIGYNNIDVVAATEQGIPVSYVPDASTAEVSDHAMALILSFSRKLISVNQAAKEGTWQSGRGLGALVHPLHRLNEQTLGLIGLGRIGKAISQKAKAFGLKILVHDPYVTEATARELGIEPVDLEKLLSESDYISIHAPLTEETRHLFKLEQFRKMKPSAYIINTSRGGLIDEQALITALSKGYIAGAGLDVTDPEPPHPDNPLLKLKNTIITAHSAFYSERSAEELRQCAIQAVLDALTGKWPVQLANPEVKDRPNCRLKPV